MRTFLYLVLAFGAGIAATVSVAVVTRPIWQPWLIPPKAAEHERVHEPEEAVKLSPQAQANLRLVVKPVQPELYWKTVQMPGTVVELPGKSDRAVTAPAAGVVKRVHVYPWDMVRPGDELFTLELVSEYLQNAQTQLYKTARELALTREQRTRLIESDKTGVIPAARLLELDYQEQRLEVARQASRRELAARGLTKAQLDGAEKGDFTLRMTVHAPGKVPGAEPPAERLVAVASPPPDEAAPYEVQELKVNLGEQVQAGQLLCYLTDHQNLYIEGRGFKSDVPLLERVARQGWFARAEFARDAEAGWLDARKELPGLVLARLLNPNAVFPLFPDDLIQIRFLANVIDAGSQTFPFYAPLANQYHEYRSAGKTHRIWRFRPGQRVRLHVPVEKLESVFVLPADAVVREGAEAYVFRQNGELFERRPVHVLHADRRHAVVANDGSILPGTHLAHNAAAQLNFALKAQASEGEGGHHHHDH